MTPLEVGGGNLAKNPGSTHVLDLLVGIQTVCDRRERLGAVTLGG